MNIPSGFVLHKRTSPVTQPWEPIYVKEADDRILLAIEVRAEHTNSRGLLHGGLLAALADNAMGLSLGRMLDSAGRDSSRGPITLSLSIDFVDRAAIGEWLEIDTVFVKVTKRQGFAQAFATVDSRVIARANATFAIDAGEAK